jgi:hypothetical protein
MMSPGRKADHLEREGDVEASESSPAGAARSRPFPGVWIVTAVFGLLAVTSLATTIWWHVANLSSPEVFRHLDAPIPLAVEQHIAKVGWPDTNWMRADLPDYHKNGQYNFSSYILGFVGFDRISSLNHDADLSLFSIVCWLGFIAAAGWAAARQFGLLGAAIVVAGLAVTPLLVQDSFYGRPEAFLTLLTVLSFLLSARNGWISQIAAGLVAGLGIACKISFAPFALVTIVAPLLLRGRQGWGRALASIPACLVGFALGAPGVLVEPGAFLEGVAFLQKQYSGYHFPHGSLDDGLVPQALHAVFYYLAMVGPLALLLILASSIALAVFALKPGADWKTRAPRLHLLAFVLAAGGTVVFFSIQRTFFERNISHAAPMLWMAVAWAAVSVAKSNASLLRSPAARIGVLAVVLVALLPMTVLSARIAAAIGGRDTFWATLEYKAAEARALEPGVPVVTIFDWFEKQIAPDLCKALHEARGRTIVKLLTTHSPQKIPRPDDGRVILIAAARGAFDDLPLSTLHTYHSLQSEYYLLRPDLKLASGDCGP